MHRLVMLNLWTLSKWASTDHQCSTKISISCWRRKTVISILLPDWSDSTSHWSDGVSDKVTWLLKNHRRRPDFPIYDRIQFISIVFFIGWNHKAALQGLATTCLSVSRLPPPPQFHRRSLIVQLFITNQQNPPFLQSSLSLDATDIRLSCKEIIPLRSKTPDPRVRNQRPHVYFLCLAFPSISQFNLNQLSWIKIVFNKLIILPVYH